MMKASNRVLLYLLFIPVFLLSDAVTMLPEVLRETNFFLIGTLAVILATYLSARGQIRLGVSDPLLAPILLMTFSLALPLLSAAYLWDALRGWVPILIGALVYFTVSRSGMERDGGEKVVTVLSGCTIAVVAYALLVHFTRATPAQFLDSLDESFLTEEMRKQMMFAVLLGRAKALFGNPNHLAAFTNLLVAAPLALLILGRKLGWRMFSAVCVVAHLWLLYLTKSRAGMLSFAAGLMILVAIWMRMRGDVWRRLSRRVIFTAAGVVVLGGTVFLLAGGYRYLRPLLHAETLRTRIVWWKAAIELIPSSPVWGSGLRMFAVHFPNIRRIGAPESQFIHNLYLEYAVAGGPLALFALFWLQLGACRAVWRSAKTAAAAAQPVILAAVFGISAFWIHACFDFVQEQIEIFFFLFFYLGLLGWAVAGPSLAVRRRAGHLRVGTVAVLMLSIWVFLLVLPWQGAMHLAEGRAVLEEKPPRLGRSNRQMEVAARWMPLASEPLYYLACNAFFGAGEPGTAIRFMREAVRRNPSMPHYHGTLARMLWAAGEREAAMDEISLAIRLHPAKPEYYIQRSEYRLKMGDEPGAAVDRQRGRIREEAEEVWIPDLEKLLPQP